MGLIVTHFRLAISSLLTGMVDGYPMDEMMMVPGNYDDNNHRVPHKN